MVGLISFSPNKGAKRFVGFRVCRVKERPVGYRVDILIRDACFGERREKSPADALVVRCRRNATVFFCVYSSAACLLCGLK